MHDPIVDPWGPRSPVGPGEPWSERVDEFLLDGTKPDRWVQTASVLHSNGDTYDVAVQDGRLVGVRGRAGDRVNRGRLGPKDLFGWQANASVDRLATPLVRRDGELRPASWEEAMGAIVDHDNRLLGRARENASEVLGRRPEGGLLLLRDLRELHLLYAAASIDWVILAQGAQAAQHAELLKAVTHAHAQTLRGLKWTVTRIKTAAPQVLTS